MNKKFLIAIVVLMCLNIVSFAEIKKDQSKIVGYWEVQKVSIKGKEDGGEAGAYWIFREDGSFKIVKRGRKTEGKWFITAENKLELKLKDKVILDGNWSIEKEILTISTKGPVFTFIKRDLKTEPTEPRKY